DYVRDCQSIHLYARRPPGVQVVSLSLVKFKGLLPAVAVDSRQLAVDEAAALAEVVDLAADLLLPGTAGVGRKRERGVRFLRAVGGFTRTRLSGRLTRHGVTRCKRARWRRPRRVKNTGKYGIPERCQSGRMGRSRKPVWGLLHRGFESRPLRFAIR